MKKSYSWLFVAIASTLSICGLYAIPATPDSINITQPDGSQIAIRLHGDEFFNYSTTLDGYTLTRNKKGILTYARTNAKGELISTRMKASNIEKRTVNERKYIQKISPNTDFSTLKVVRRTMRSANIGSSSPMRVANATSSTNSTETIKKSYPLTGSPKSLVILVNFSDLSFVTSSPKTAFTNLLNQSGYSANGGTGSARDYFSDNSMGVFNPQFDVVGPYTLPDTMGYYGINSVGFDLRPRQMVIDACKAANNDVDFSQYDTDNDGIVDNIFIYYAGYNEAEGGKENSVWPHRWDLSNTVTKFDGVRIYDYACTSELRKNSGALMCGIGTFCHEFGHVLGLPDYYPTDNATHHTLRTWDIMDYGAYLNSGRTPPSYSAYNRFYLNWLIPTEIKEAGSYTLDTLNTSNKAYIFTQYGNHNLNGSNPSPVQFFTLENRQKSGWDSYLPGHGLLITRIYYNASTWENNTPNNNATAMGVDIMEADGIATNSSLSGDVFPYTSINIVDKDTTITVTSNYTPTLRDNTNINKPITKIKETNGIISFNFSSNIETISNFQTFSTVRGTPSAIQIAKVNGEKLKGDINISFKNGEHFEMKKASDPETSWGKTITLTAVNSIVDTTIIQIRYNPTVPSYTTNHVETLILTAGTPDNIEVVLTGTSTRPVYVVPPVATDATDNKYSGFVAHWNPVLDSIGHYAPGYYITIYTATNGESSFSEGFDNGLTPANKWIITPKSISNSTSYSGVAVPALQFSNTDEYVETEDYVLPATKLSFFIRSMIASNGGFVVDAQNEQKVWTRIDSIAVSETLNTTKSYAFDVSKGYNRFRFTYKKGLGSVAFDDVTVGFAKQITYAQHEQWVTTAYDTISNLAPSTEYSYRVRASDKNTVYEYENITDFSNTITTTTLAYPTETGLLVIPDANGNITVGLFALNVTINVYNLLGQCVKTIPPSGNPIVIKNLPKDQIYIIKASNRIAKMEN